ncbi:cartilage matrix protein-like [Montipora foliosa]|uniref:cartilage matrix protein-like n=1 Tax=Montipora foliosa TaxID=591990 RepID=UPI0035F1BB0D
MTHYTALHKTAYEIAKVRNPDNSTNDQAAFTEAKKLFDDPFSGGRIYTAKAVFLVLTAHSDLKQHLSIAIELKRLGAQIFLVAVGAFNGDGIKDMLSVVSLPPEKYLHRVGSFRELLLVIQRVVERTCPGKFIEKDYKNQTLNDMIMPIVAEESGATARSESFPVPIGISQRDVTRRQGDEEATRRFGGVTAFKDIPSYDYTATSIITNFLQVASHGIRDVVIIIEGSPSVKRSDFEDAKTALEHLVRSENQSGVDTKYAAITFSDKGTQLSFRFLPSDEAADKIEKIPYPDNAINDQFGGPYVDYRAFHKTAHETGKVRNPNNSTIDQSAFTEAKKLFDDPLSGGRIYTAKAVFLVLTAHSDLKQHLSKAIELKRLGAQIFLVAVGACNGDGIKDMLSVVSLPPEKYLHRVESFGELLLVIQRVVERTCPGKFIEKAIQKLQKVPEPEITLQQLYSIMNINLDKPSSLAPQTEKNIVVLMDDSSSIEEDQFDKGKQALKHMMEIEKERGRNTKFAVVTYSSNATVNFSFLPVDVAANEIEKIYHSGGRTNTQAALVEARKLFEAHERRSGGRSGATKTIYLVTDGQSNVQQDRTIPEAETLKRIGVEIFVVAVGSYIQGIEEMVKVASYPPEKFVCRVKNHEGFLCVVQMALRQVAPGKYVVDW